MKKQNNQNKIPHLYFGFSFIVYFLLLNVTASAQFELPNIGNIKPAIILNSDPVTPLPNSAVAITASLSGITGVGDSNYAWFLNGARQTGASGLNKNTFAFRTGSVGTVYRVNVSATTPKARAVVCWCACRAYLIQNALQDYVALTSPPGVLLDEGREALGQRRGPVVGQHLGPIGGDLADGEPPASAHRHLVHR